RPGGVSVLLSNGDGTFQPTRNFGGGRFQTVAVGDFNGDGRLDLAAGGQSGLAVLLGNGDGTFQEERSVPFARTGWFVAVGDFNGDGRPDLAVVDHYIGIVSVLLGNGDGSFQQAQDFGVGGENAWSVAVGDFNRDGRPDLVTANWGRPGNVSVLINNTPMGDVSFLPARNFFAGD